MSRILSNYIYNLVYQVVTLLVPLLTAPYLARTLGPDGVGTYSYVNSMTGLICSLTMLGIFQYGNRQIAYVRDQPQKLNETFWQIMSARIIISVFATVVYFVVIIAIGRYTTYFVIYYTYMLGYFVDCTWLFVGVEDMKWAALKNILLKVLSVVGIFAFVKTTSDVSRYILIQGGSVLLANLMAYPQLKKYVHRPKIDFTDLKKTLIGSVLLYLPQIASTLYLQCDKIMIELISGESSQVSFYDYSEKLITIPLSFITVLSTVMMPRIANEFQKSHKEQISILINRAAKISMFLAFPLMFGMISIADHLIPWYLGDDFLPTILAIQLISPIIITNTLTGISGNQYFTATNQITVLLKAQVLAAVGNVILNAILIPKLGFVGAAIATVFSSITCASIQYYELRKQIGLPGLMRDSIKYMFISIIMWLVIYLTTRNMNISPLTTIVQIIIGCAVYFILCILTRDKQFFEFLTIIRKILHI